MAKGVWIAAPTAAFPGMGCAAIGMAEAASPVFHASADAAREVAADGEHVFEGIPYGRPPGRHAASDQTWTWNIGAGAPPLPSNLEICR